MFGNMAEQAALNMMQHADLNKDGKPDLEQMQVIAADFGKAADDFHAAVDWSKAGAAFAALQEAAPKILLTVNVDLLKNHEIDFGSVFSELNKPAVRQEIGKIFISFTQLLSAVEQSKLEVAVADLKRAWEGIQEYCKGFEQHKAIGQH